MSLGIGIVENINRSAQQGFLGLVVGVQNLLIATTDGVVLMRDVMDRIWFEVEWIVHGHEGTTNMGGVKENLGLDCGFPSERITREK